MFITTEPNQTKPKWTKSKNEKKNKQIWNEIEIKHFFFFELFFQRVFPYLDDDQCEIRENFFKMKVK